jgi:hypothetical protein
MKKINQEAKHPNDVPVIFLYDDLGHILKKISINEWRELKSDSQKIEEFEIKLYREAITYYAQEDYMQATDLLKFLISQTDYTHYEYVERLANIYRIQQNVIAEKQLLLSARSSIKNLEFSEGIIKRIDQRLAKVEALPHSSVAYI